MNRRYENPRYTLLRKCPDAAAKVYGSPKYPQLKGKVQFFQTKSGVIVEAEFWNLPDSAKICNHSIHALHIHEGCCCTGNRENPFEDAGSHYNPGQCPHPQHAGDLPPLFSNQGYAWSVFLTSRFRVCDIVKRTVIVHGSFDDFVTQPSGNAGEMIGCGVILS